MLGATTLVLLQNHPLEFKVPYLTYMFKHIYIFK
uniref:Uncharacterized protein n=1 Tax=Anguilla anguilla TaxID=7936 RepID=A0A0E9XG98_ANGAN